MERLIAGLVGAKIVTLGRGNAMYVRRCVIAVVGVLLSFGSPQVGESAVVDLLSMVNLNQDVVSGNWQWTYNHELIVDNLATGSISARLAFPYHPPLEYDYTLIFTPTTGSPRDNVAQLVSHGDVPFTWSMCAGPGGGNTSRLEDINGHSVIGNPFLVPYTFVGGVEYTSIVHVRNDGVVIEINGQTLVNHQTDYSDLSRNGKWTLPDELDLGIGAWNGPTTIHSATVTTSEATVPEPTTLIIWSLLGGLALGLGWWRRKRTA
jgi:hypothetical protein